MKDDEQNLKGQSTIESRYTISGLIYVSSKLVLHRLCVDPHRQREGIGSRLMNFAETFGHEQGYTSLQLDTRISNHTAANLYEQLGYTKTGTITRNRGNFICYEKKL